MDGFRGYLAQGKKHEISLRQAGMRDLKPSRVQGPVAGEQDVDIDYPGPAVRAGYPSHLHFDGFHRIQELLRPQLRLHLNDLIQEPGLLSGANRLCLINRGTAQDPDR